MHPKKLQNVLGMSGSDRFSYFIRKVADFGKLWGLFKDGWAMGSDDDGRTAVLFWPEKDFAESYAAEKLEDHRPDSIDLDYFIEKWIPGMNNDKFQVAVFPTPTGRAVFVSPDFLAQAITEERKGLEGS
jgi:hypothetical protein